MVHPDSVPLPGFATCIPTLITSTVAASVSTISTSVGPGSSSTSRKSKENRNGVFNPPRRIFSVKIPAEDAKILDGVRNAILYKKFKRARTDSTNTLVCRQEGNAAKSQGSSDEKNGTSSQKKLEREKSILENRKKALIKESNQEKTHLEQAREKVLRKREIVHKLIEERDAKLKKLKSETFETPKDDKIISGMRIQRNELSAKIKAIDGKFKEMEEKWKKEDAEKKQQLAKDAEERKRKAAEQMEERQKKKKKPNKEPEVSEKERLEDELKENDKELTKLDQTQSKIIWLMKQIVKIQNEQSARQGSGEPRGYKA